MKAPAEQMLMIRLSCVHGSGYTTHYVAPSNIARVTEAGASCQWHGIRSFVRTFDGETLECNETADQIARMIATATEPTKGST